MEKERKREKTRLIARLFPSFVVVAVVALSSSSSFAKHVADGVDDDDDETINTHMHTYTYVLALRNNGINFNSLFYWLAHSNTRLSSLSLFLSTSILWVRKWACIAWMLQTEEEEEIETVFKQKSNKEKKRLSCFCCFEHIHIRIYIYVFTSSQLAFRHF